MDTQRLLLYMALSFLGLILYQTWQHDYNRVEPVPTELAAEGVTTATPAPAPADLPQAAGTPTQTAQASAVPGNASAPAAPAVRVKTDVLDVSISSVGGTIESVLLLDYPVSIKKPDEPFTLLSNKPSRFLAAESGLQSRANEPAPTHLTPLTSTGPNEIIMNDGGTIAVPFSWVSDKGVEVTKTLTLKAGSYEIDVEYNIVNNSNEPWPVNQYRQLKRKRATSDEKQQFVNTYIGAVLSNDEDIYNKISLGDIEDDNLSEEVTNGWVAMIQHYFAAAWIPSENENNTAYTRFVSSADNRYIIGMVSDTQSVPVGGTAKFSTKAYIGPKIQKTLAAAAPNLDLTVDYGWLSIIARPLFWLLDKIHGLVGNWGWAIIFTTVVIKAFFYKLSEASYKSMARMKLLQPKLASLKERYGDDRAKMGQATMDLYKKEKVNPLGGCLPMLVQIPVFIALYWTLLESVELRQAPWMFHIKDLSIKDPLFILPVLMAVSMYIQQKLNPAPVDPIQAKVFQFLPLIFGVFFAMFPAGLVLYWVVNNTLSIMQQYYITRYVIGDGTKKAK